MSEEPKDIIRFIDSKYKTLFFLPNGENIIVTRPDGERLTRSCRFLDPTHTLVGREVYHIWQFASLMEKAGNTYAPEKIPELPPLCASVLPTTGELILIEKGKKGYQKAGFSTPDPQRNRQEADRYNQYKRVTPQMEAAMLGGALKGWASPAAHVSGYDVHGKPVKSPRTKNKSREAER